jgi:hypothetical protein
MENQLEKDKKLLESLKMHLNKKEEIFLLEDFIIRYKSDDQYDGYIYKEIFNLLINSKLDCINEK